MVLQRPQLQLVAGSFSYDDAIMIVIDRDIVGTARSAELGHERAIIRRKYLHASIDTVSNEQMAATWFERQALWLNEPIVLGGRVTGREHDSTIRLGGASLREHWSEG